MNRQINNTSSTSKAAAVATNMNEGLSDLKALNRFNILVAKEVIPHFSGDYKHLVSFLAVVGLLNDSMKPEDKQTLLEYVYFVKLSSEVRVAVSIPKKPTNFEELKNRLCRRYKEIKPRNYTDKLEEELNSLQQGDLSVLEFREKVLQIHDQLAFERVKHLKDNKAIEIELKELAGFALDRFKFGVNLPFNTELSLCETLDDAVETVMYLETTGELDDMNTSDEDRALIRAGFWPLGYGLPKAEKKEEPPATTKSQQAKPNVMNVGYISCVSPGTSTNNNNKSENLAPQQQQTRSFFGDKNYITLKCKNAKGREPLKFFIRNIAPYSVVKKHKVCAGDINYFNHTYAAPDCLGMEQIKSIGTIQLVMNLKPGVNLKFIFLVVEESDFQIHTDAMIGADFMEEHVTILDYGKNAKIVIKYRDALYHFPIVL